MRGMLSSFGLQAPGRSARMVHHFSHGSWPVDLGAADGTSAFLPPGVVSFHRMPPVDMDFLGAEFRPPYYLFAACEKILMDRECFGALLEHRRHRAYNLMAETMATLNAEGFVELVQYRDVLRRDDSLLQARIAADLADYRIWQRDVATSRRIWARFANRHPLGVPPLEDVGIDMPHASGLEQSLEYVNANLLIAERTHTALFDWADFAPFYRRKARRNDEAEAAGAQAVVEARKLFAKAFPRFAITSTSHLMRLLHHRHIGELRSLVDAAARGEVSFDANFARAVLEDLAALNQKVATYQRITGFVTMPLGLIPGGNLAQLAAQEVTNLVISHRLRRPLRWHFMLEKAARTRRRVRVRRSWTRRGRASRTS